MSTSATSENQIAPPDSLQQVGMRHGWDEEDEWPGEPDEYQCHDCKDTGKVAAMDGYHEYLGYDYVPCHCSTAWRWIGQLCPGRKPCDC